MDWYAGHGYDFLAITDHERVVDTSRLASPLVMLPGVELAGRDTARPVHVNAIGATSQPGWTAGNTPAEALRGLVSAARSAGALPMVNHPNWRWTLSTADLMSLDGVYLIEIYNGAGVCNEQGDSAHPSVEAMWDSLLMAGRTVYAVATGDAHNYWEFGPARMNPGRAWVVVRTRERTCGAILSAIRQGDFYASNGVALEDIRFAGMTLSVSVRTPGCRLWFVVAGGRVAAQTRDNPASYTLRPGEMYVRAVATAPDGSKAWTQAYRP